jgi:hypothetical protein
VCTSCWAFGPYFRRELDFFRAPPERAPEREEDERVVARRERLPLERAELAFFAEVRRDVLLAVEVRADFLAELRRDVLRADDFFELDLRPLDFTAMNYPPLDVLLMSDGRQP